MKHQGDSDTNHCQKTWNNLKEFEKVTWRTGIFYWGHCHLQKYYELKL